MKNNRSLVTEEDLRNLLFKVIEREGSQWKAATFLHVNPSYLNNILLHNCPLGKQIPSALGYKKVVMYERIP